jgi:predicted metal-binding membrane protein
MMDAMPGPVAPTRAVLFAAMWIVMMAAMMLPAVTPIVLLFRTVQRAWAAQGKLAVPTSSFVGGYLAVWLAAGIAAFLIYALVQGVAGRLHADSGWLPYLGGAIVVSAGIYQLTPLKNVCLRHCRSPFHFLMHGWGEGRMGAFRTGAGHGIFCLGCCWGIMAVLLVVGLMNLAWMAALSLLITVEKLAPRGMLVARSVGGLFIVLGALVAFWPSVFSPSGLTMSAGMNMGQHAAQMPGMQTAGMTDQEVYQATAGPYRLTLSIGPAERMLTIAEAKRTHARSGEVMLDGMMSGSPAMAGMQMLRHVEVHVVDRAMGMQVTNAQVKLQLVNPAGAAQNVSVMRMYGVQEGIKDLHYGANVNLSTGIYTVRVRVNGHLKAFKVHVG